MTPTHERRYWLHLARQQDAAARRAADLGHVWLVLRCEALASKFRERAESCARAAWWKRWFGGAA